MSLQSEIQDVLKAFRGPLAEGETWYSRTHEIVREVSDVAGAVLDAYDKENQIKELEALQDEISVMAMKAINSAENRPPRWIRRWVPVLLEAGVEWAVDAMKEYGIAASEWAETELVPLLEEHRDTVDHIINNFKRAA